MDDWQKKYYMNKAKGISPIPSQLQQQQTHEYHQQTTLSTKPVNVCTLKENATIYQAIDCSGFGATNVFVIRAGTLPPQYQGREFQYSMQKSECIILESQSQLVDMGKIDQNKKIALIKISGPFMGSFYTTLESLNFPFSINPSMQSTSRVLKG